AIVGAGTAFFTDADQSQLHIDVVVEYGHPFGGDLEIIHGRAHTLTAVVHVGFRLEKINLGAGDDTLAVDALEAGLIQLDAVPAGQIIHGDVAAVVPGPGITGTGVAQAHNKPGVAAFAAALKVS